MELGREIASSAIGDRELRHRRSRAQSIEIESRSRAQSIEDRPGRSEVAAPRLQRWYERSRARCSAEKWCLLLACPPGLGLG